MSSATEGRHRQQQNVRQRFAAYLKNAEETVNANTARALRSDVAIFCDWCEAHGRVAVPAEPDTVTAFLHDMALSKSPSTVRRYGSSVAVLHRRLNEESPTINPSVKAALKQAGDSAGRRKPPQGLTWPLCRRLIDAGGDRPIDARNRALLTVAYDSLLRRSELAMLKVKDLSINADGSATLRCPPGAVAAGDPDAPAILAPDTLAHVERWLERSGVRGGRLFRSVRRGGRLGPGLNPTQIPRIYRDMARRAGLAPEVVAGISGNSTRVGAVQDMIAEGIPLPEILRAGRWKSAHMVQVYAEALAGSGHRSRRWPLRREGP